MGVTYINPYLVAPFSPLSLSPNVWLDASDSTTITSSGSPAKVSEWRDKSGNARHVAQATSTNQPTTGSETQNGLNLLTWDGNDFMTGVTGITGNMNLTMFAVARINTTGSTRVIAMLGSQTTNNGLGFGFNGPGNFYNAFIWGGAESQTATNPGVNTHRTFAVTRAAGGNIQLYVNNVAQTANATATMNVTTTFNVGRSGAVTLYWGGTIGEIIVYNSVLSADNIAAVQAYLNAKWAVY